MTNEQFDALVIRLEAQARKNPQSYQLRVFLLALLGNTYLVAMLLIIGGLLTLLCASVLVLKFIVLKFIPVVAFFLWSVLRALWITIDPPTGTKVTRDQAPELFAMIDELRQQLDTSHFHEVLVTDAFNAGVVQTPRLGIFGWPRNYLLIGLPLMKSLTKEQFKAVLAHEFGHLAKGHGRLSNWIYRQRMRWIRLLTLINANESRGSFLFKPFLQWFAPYFNAYSFPLARINEYSADATSARLTSPRAAAEALTSVSVVSSYLAEKYWPEIHKQADEQPQPNFAPYFEFGREVAANLGGESTQKWLEQALSLKTNSADTHPALSDRLKAIGESAYLVLPREEQAADQLLGKALAGITDHFDQAWQNKISPSWQKRYHEIQNNRSKLSDLNARFVNGAELSVAEANERAILTDSISQNPEDALAQLRTLYERAPDNPQVCFNLGARLLNIEDIHGRVLIEQAMRLDDNSIISGCQVLRNYYWRHEQRAEADTWHQRMLARANIQEATRKERRQILLGSEYSPHGLSAETVTALRNALKEIPGLRKGYLVRKQLKHHSEIPCYVFSYRATGFMRFHSQARANKVLKQMQAGVVFPDETVILNVDGNRYKFERKFRKIRGSRVL